MKQYCGPDRERVGEDDPNGVAGPRVYNRARQRLRAHDIDVALAPPSILLAEDNQAMREMLARQLRASGYEVLAVENGGELFEQVADRVLTGGEVQPDLLISDILLPGLTGLEVLGALRTADWAMPVILITAFGDEATHAEAERLGAIQVFDKPFAVEELLDTVRELLPLRSRGPVASLNQEDNR